MAWASLDFHAVTGFTSTVPSEWILTTLPGTCDIA